MGRFCPIGSGGAVGADAHLHVRFHLTLGIDSLKPADVGGFREEIQNKYYVATFWRISHMNHPGLVRFAATLVLALLDGVERKGAADRPLHSRNTNVKAFLVTSHTKKSAHRKSKRARSEEPRTHATFVWRNSNAQFPACEL